MGVAIEDGGVIYIDDSPIICGSKLVMRVILNPEVLAYFGFQGTSELGYKTATITGPALVHPEVANNRMR